jgi:outer membrane protein OmpA-like peptidoglycan-associated protein
MGYPFNFEIEPFELQPDFETGFGDGDGQRDFFDEMETWDSEFDMEEEAGETCQHCQCGRHGAGRPVYPGEQELADENEGFNTVFEDSEWEDEINRNSVAYVRWLQSALNRTLGPRLAVDGRAGPATRSALRSFQQRSRLTVDGIAGPRTEQALISAGVSPPPGYNGPGRVIHLPPVVITAPGFVLDRFQFNQTAIEPYHEAILKQIAERVQQSWRSSAPIRTIRLVGHTDPAGSASYNLTLGARRGLAVRRGLARELEQKERGLSRRVLIMVHSKGEREPRESNDTAKGRALNRRVEVYLSTRVLQPRRPPQRPVVPPTPHVPIPHPAPRPATPASPPPGCDRSGLERGVNACIADTRTCVINAHKQLAGALARCRMNPWCNARATASYYLALRRCRDELLACDRRVKQETRCT